MIRRHYVLLCALLLAAHLTGCRAARPTPNATQLEYNLLEKARPDSISPSYGLQTPKSSVAEYHANATQPPGFLSGIGTVFSTPAGVARRQAVRLARASVPKSIKVKDGAFSWGGDAVAIGKKAGPAIVKSDSVTQQVATNAVAGRGNTATQTATETKAKDWKAVLAGPVGIAGAVVLLAAAAYGIYLLLPLLPRRRKDPVV